MKSHNIIAIAPIVLGLGGQAVEALGFRTHGHKFHSRIRSSFFFVLFLFVSQIRDNGLVRVNLFTNQLVGKACKMGYSKVVLDHVCVIIYKCLCAPQCLSTCCTGGT